MKKREKDIFLKVAEHVSRLTPKDTVIVAFGSRTKEKKCVKCDFDIMVHTKEAQRFCGKTIGRNFEKNNKGLKDDEGKELGKEVFLDIQFISTIYKNNKRIILFKDGKIQN